MTNSTTKTSIGGWAETILEQTNEAACASARRRALLERLGSFFLGTLDESLTEAQRADCLIGATAFAKEVKRVVQSDITNANKWAMAWVNDAVLGGVPTEVACLELDAISVKEECNRNPAFLAKIRAAHLKVLDES